MNTKPSSVSSRDAVDRAAKYFGSQHALAKALGIQPMAVSQWKKRRVPLEHCIAIERLTQGEIKASELRPDVYGDHAA